MLSRILLAAALLGLPLRGVAEEADAGEAPPEDAQAAYDRSYVWFEDWVAMQVRTGSVVRQWSVAYQGKERRELEGASFYEAIGQPGLADRYRTNTWLKGGLVVGGLTAMVGGSLWMLQDIDVDCRDVYPNDDHCTSDLPLYGGGSLLLGGAVTTLIGWFYDPNPVSAPEAKRLADQHNDQLRKRLGLTMGPMQGGGGLSLSGSFR